MAKVVAETEEMKTGKKDVAKGSLNCYFIITIPRYLVGNVSPWGIWKCSVERKWEEKMQDAFCN